MTIPYSQYVGLKVGDQIRVRGKVRTVRFFRGYHVAYMVKNDLSSCHWTEIQEVLPKQIRSQSASER